MTYITTSFTNELETAKQSLENHEQERKRRELRRNALRRLESRSDSEKLNLCAREVLQLETLQRAIVEGSLTTLTTLMRAVAREPEQLSRVMSTLSADMRLLGICITWTIDPIANAACPVTGQLIVDDGRHALIVSTDFRMKPQGEMRNPSSDRLASCNADEMMQLLARSAENNAIMPSRRSDGLAA